MADTSIAVTAGAGTNIDTRTEATNGNHRQVVVIGDPATNAGVAPVDVTNGLAVQVIPALPAGTNAIGKLAANSGVDIGDVDITSIVPGTGATNLGKAEDGAHTTGDVGVMALTVRQNTAAATSGTDGDYQPLISDTNGRLHTLDGNSASALTALQLIDDVVLAEDASHVSGDKGVMALSVRKDTATQLAGSDGDYAPLITDSAGRLHGRVVVTDSSGNIIDPVTSVAHDSADSGNPNKMGFKATTSLSGLTLVANADRTDGFAGVDGVQITRPHCNLEDIVTGAASNTDGASTECIAAQAAGIRTYLTSVILSNTSASMITVEIEDGATAKIRLPVPATSGVIFNPPVPLRGSAATAWNFNASAATTTLYCSMIGFKSKV